VAQTGVYVLDIFNGKRLHDLELEHVRSLLDDVRAEPLHWEAKGIKVRSGEVREQICGFAISHDGGYLILGTGVDNGEWLLDGVPFPDNDPPAWVSSVAEGVRPYPDGLDTHPILVERDLWVAVSWIPPTPTPPCNAHGTVYERVSGRTVSVREPLRLAQLFARGDGARERAREFAHVAANVALTEVGGPFDDNTVRFGLGLCATGYAPDIGSRLFSPRFWDVLAAATLRPHGPGVTCGQSQTAVIGRAGPMSLDGTEWYVHATWNGSVAVGCNLNELSHLPGLVEGIRDAWQLTSTLIAELEPAGGAYLWLEFRGSPVDSGQLARGPISLRLDEGLMPGIERELMRAAGRMAFEETN